MNQDRRVDVVVSVLLFLAILAAGCFLAWILV